jgi:hypothetical protein
MEINRQQRLDVMNCKHSPWVTVLLEKKVIPQAIKICPLFYGTHRFIAVFK